MHNVSVVSHGTSELYLLECYLLLKLFIVTSSLFLQKIILALEYFKPQWSYKIFPLKSCAPQDWQNTYFPAHFYV